MKTVRCPQAWSLARRAARQARDRQTVVCDQVGGERWRIEDLLQLHGNASMAVILLVLALVTLLPVAGVGTVLSLGILTWAWTWARHRETLPGMARIARLPLPQALAPRSLRWLARLHLVRSRWLRPRLQQLQTASWRWLWALWVALMALIIFLPIPLGNLLPALSLLLFGLGLMARDGVMLLISLAPGAGALAVLAFSAHWLMAAFAHFWPLAPAY
jgi:hypothetical protein